MYLTHNEGKSIVTERFIATFRNTWLRYQKNVYIDKLADIVNVHILTLA